MTHNNKEIKTVDQIVEVLANWINKNIVKFAPASYDEGFAEDWAREQFEEKTKEGWNWSNKRFPSRLIQLLEFYQNNFIKAKRPNEMDREMVLDYISEFIKIAKQRDAEGLKSAFRSFTRPVAENTIVPQHKITRDDYTKYGKPRLSKDIDVYYELEGMVKLTKRRKK